MKRVAITVVLLAAGLVAGCDPSAALCMEAVHYHTQRCGDGDSASCEWMLEHIEPTTGVCIG